MLLVSAGIVQGLTTVVIGVFFDTLHANTLTWKVPVIVPSGKHGSTTDSSISTCLCATHSDNNVFALSSGEHLWDKRCLQGLYHGQQLFVVEVSDPTYFHCLELDRQEGWRHCRFLGGSFMLFLHGIEHTTWVWPSTFHLRVLLFQADSGTNAAQALLSDLPLAFPPFCCRL